MVCVFLCVYMCAHCPATGEFFHAISSRLQQFFACPGISRCRSGICTIFSRLSGSGGLCVCVCVYVIVALAIGTMHAHSPIQNHV